MALRRPFEGEGRQLVYADPDRSRSGFFYARCFLSRVGLHSFLPCGGRVGEGKQAMVLPKRGALPPSFLQPLADTACNALLCVPRVLMRRLQGQRDVRCVWARPQEYRDDHRHRPLCEPH